MALKMSECWTSTSTPSSFAFASSLSELAQAASGLAHVCDHYHGEEPPQDRLAYVLDVDVVTCLLYTSDAADE